MLKRRASMADKIIYRKVCSIALLISIFACVGIINSCGTTQQANLWVDQSYHATPMTKILVIAMRKDQLRRRIWEDGVVASIQNKKNAGTVVVASYSLFPNNLPDTLAMRLRIKEEGIDGVLLIASAQRDTFTTDVPGYTSNEAITTYSHKWNAYITRYEDVYHPGYSETETTISVRTDLLVPQEDGRVVWSVTSQSVDPTSADQFIGSVADRVADQLKKRGFIY
jgi:hypothetical protein